MIVDLEVVHYHKMFKKINEEHIENFVAFSDIEYYANQIANLRYLEDELDGETEFEECRKLAQQLFEYDQLCLASRLRSAITIDPQTGVIIVDEGIKVEYKKRI